MSLAKLALATAASVGTLLLLGAARPATADANVAEKYSGCPSGYTFQTSGSNARCYLAGTQSTATIVCGFGYVKAIDQFNANRDACQHQMTNAVANYTCPSGYQSKVQAGPDICMKEGTPSIIAPSVEKSI